MICDISTQKTFPGSTLWRETFETEASTILKRKEKEIKMLEDENARLRLLKNVQVSIQGSSASGSTKTRSQKLQDIILPNVKQIVKGYQGGDEEWEEMERRRNAWKGWKETLRDFHTIHIYDDFRSEHLETQEGVSASPEDQRNHEDCHWRRAGRHDPTNHLKVLLETDLWKKGWWALIQV